MSSAVGSAVGAPGWPARPKLRLRLLNAFEASMGDHPIVLPMSAQRVIAFLALHGRPLLRSFVAGALWLDSAEDRAAASLRSVLWRMEEPAPRLLEASNQHLALSPAVEVDLTRARNEARLVLESSFDLQRADAVKPDFEQDVLPQWYEDWVLVERERFRQLRLRTLETLSRQLLLADRFGPALEAGMAAVAAEPLRESAHRAVIAVHLAEGNQAEAVRQYRMYRRLLHDELDAEPSPLIEDVMEGVLGHGRAS